MGLVTVMSAKGAPGVTTTTLLLANLWPAQSIVVDADPLGGDIALRLGGANGRAMDPDRGMLSLLPVARRGLTADHVLQHTQTAVGGQPVVAGLPGPEQAQAVGPLWATLGEAFSRMPGIDVFADLGQVQGRSAHAELIQHSAVLLVVFRPTSTSVVHTIRRLDSLAELLSTYGIPVGLIGIGDRDEDADCRQAAAMIGGDRPHCTYYGVVAHDPKAVVMFEGGVVYRPEKTMLARSGATIAERLYADLMRDHAIADAAADAERDDEAAPVEPAPADVSAEGAPSGARPPAPGEPTGPPAQEAEGRIADSRPEGRVGRRRGGRRIKSADEVSG